MMPNMMNYKHGWKNLVFICGSCGEGFRSNKACATRIPRYCSSRCYGKSLIKWSYCKQCDGKYNTVKTNGNRNKCFCSKECGVEWQRGRELSDQHKKALSEAKKGKKIPHLHTPEVRQKISNALMGKPQPWMRGKNHPNYKDGGKGRCERIKDMGRVDYKEWRRQVYKRDDYTCQCCLDRGGELRAHHIKSWAEFPDLRYDVSNGLTLCNSCHCLEHTGKSRIRAIA